MLLKLAVTFAIAFLASLALTPVARFWARRVDAVDRPSDTRKRHGRPVPLLGGAAVAGALTAAMLALLAFGWLPGEHILAKYVYGLIAAAFILAVGGALDDRYSLKPYQQLVWPVLAVAAIVVSGIGVSYITNPLGGLVYLDSYMVTVLWWDGLPYRLTLLADIFTVVWLMGMTYTTKTLDGLDGLVSGLAVIGGLVIAAVSMMREVSQPDTALLALAVAGVFAGFLVFNVHPASIFLGEGGATIAGFLLGVLAIVSGGKIATALLILGLPIFDLAAVIVRRVASGKSWAVGDRSHLHFLLVDAGYNPRHVVAMYWFLAALFGVSTLMLRGSAKVVAIGVILSVLLAALAGTLILRKRRTAPDAPDEARHG
ncbi:glycosyltransferase family 4 protein [Patescibacteria group bacterium]